MTFRDIPSISLELRKTGRFDRIVPVPIGQLRARFAILKLLNRMYLRILPVVDLSVKPSWSFSHLARRVARILLFPQSKVWLWRDLFSRLYSEERPQFVILNRRISAQAREDALKEAEEKKEIVLHSPAADTRIKRTLFYQLYKHIGRLSDPALLRRRAGQAWMVKFVGEGGHDVGGMFNESIVEICGELQTPVLLPLLILCPNGVNNIGNNRGKYMPNPRATSEEHLKMFEFIGRLMGLAGLDSNQVFPLDLVPLVWKFFCGSSVVPDDLKDIDLFAFNFIEKLSNPNENQITEETFDSTFPELFFTTSSASGQIAELIPGGANIRVTFDKATQYAQLAMRYRLNECDAQLAALARGLASTVPFPFLNIFRWNELERLITGDPDFSIVDLQKITSYRGRDLGPRSRHVLYFWDVLSSLTPEDRKLFLTFVCGRNRLPSNVIGFGKEQFKISDHAQAYLSGQPDKFLPVAHTCFFHLELPRYKSRDVLREKLLYAIRNCATVDADTTHEGRLNQSMSHGAAED